MTLGTALPAPTAPLFTAEECGATSAYWSVVRQTDPHAIDLYRRHYSAEKNRASLSSLLRNGCVGPGETLTLLTEDASALCAWRKERWRMDGQTGVNCAIYRRESHCPHRASDLLVDAMLLAWGKWPGERLYTFIDPAKVRPIKRHGVPVWGWTFLRAGWRDTGQRSARGLVILEVIP